jgi:hypothetical protein
VTRIVFKNEAVYFCPGSLDLQDEIPSARSVVRPLFPRCLRRHLVIVASGEILLEPDVQADEEIATAHFPDGQLSRAMAPVAPSNRYDSPAVATHDGLERQLDGDIEMRRKNRPHALDGRFPVRLECVCGVVQPMPKENANKSIGKAVQDQFCEGIINDSASANETASKDTIVAFLKLLPVTNHVAAVVGVIGHHDDGRIATHRVQSMNNGTTEPVRCGILDRMEGRYVGPFLLKDFPGAVGASIVNDDDFVWNVLMFQLAIEVPNRRGDATIFIASGYDDREALERCRFLSHVPDLLSPRKGP